MDPGMDVWLFDIDPTLNESSVRTALYDVIRKASEDVKVAFSEFTIAFDKFQEDLDWEQYDYGAPKANTGVLSIGYEKVGLKVLEATTGVVETKNKYGFASKFKLRRLEVPITLALKFNDLRNLRVIPEKDFKEFIGNLAIVGQIDCGIFDEKGQFSIEKSWVPKAPFNFLSFYNRPKKWQIGLQYVASKAIAKPELWTGEYMDIPSNSIHAFLRAEFIPEGATAPAITELTFLLKSPPRFYRKEAKEEAPIEQILGDVEEPTLALPVPTASVPVEYYRVPFPSETSSEVIQLSRAYRLKLKPIPAKPLFGKEALAAAQGRTPNFLRLKTVETASVATGTWKDALEKITAGLTYPSVSMKIHKLWMNGHFLPSDIVSWLNGLTGVKTNRDALDELGEQAAEILEIMCKNSGSLTSRALKLIVSDKLLAGTSLREEFELAKTLFRPGQFPLHSPEGKLWIFGISVYPSHKEITGPILTDTNRILRKYPTTPEHFLTVTFCDNDKGFIRNEDGIRINRVIDERVMGTLRMDTGITIGGRKYDFLGYSNSSLKGSNQVWMMQPIRAGVGSTVTADTVRNSIGTYSADLLKSPSKWAARMAQAFTKTIVAASILPEKCEIRDDIKLGKYTATDGVGIISTELHALINRSLKDRDPSYEESCAFQIRCVGAKGVVCLADSSVCGGKWLVLRKSMVKFDSLESEKTQPVTIEVAGWAKKMKPPRYNRQLIQVLEYMQGDVVKQDGIPSVIRSHFDEFYKKLNPDFSSSEMERLRDLCQKSLNGYHFRLSELLFGLKTIGLEDISGSFLWNALQRLQKKEFQLAKFEAKIPIPGSFKVLGVCDEYQVLNEGEVYVRANGRTISGKILIYRSPVIHPGDVRLVKAISDLELAGKVKIGNPHLTLKKLDNTVVFATQGGRPLPTMLAGGDLDGDQYDVITEESKLILPDIRNFEAADYAAVTAAILKDKEISTIDDIAVFVGKYISEDCMGSVSNARMVLADVGDKGPCDENALKLSEACSTAVDFQKSGVNVDLVKLPGKVSARPDWMRPLLSLGFPDRRGEFYMSRKLLGQLFKIAPWIDFKEERYTNVVMRDALAKFFTGQHFAAEMVQEASRYDVAIKGFLEVTYRPILWDIYEQGQLCGIPLDEVDLFLLRSPSGADMSPDHVRLGDRLSTLIFQTDAFFKFQIEHYNCQKDHERQMILLYHIWDLISNTIADPSRLPRMPNIDADTKNFGISFAFLALNRYLYTTTTDKSYYFPS